jgi:hypothetical protein
MKALLLKLHLAPWGHSVWNLYLNAAEELGIEDPPTEEAAKGLDWHYIPSRYPMLCPQERLPGSTAPLCVILYGSVAKGTHTTVSDVDMIVIAENLASDFWERLRAFNDLRPRGVPLEALAYTPAEFAQMLDDYSITALDAVTQGYPLFGGPYFAGLQQKVEELKAKGLRRTARAWRW